MNIVFLAPPSADRADIVGLLNDSGHLAVVVETAVQAVARAGHVGVDLVLLDLAAGVEALRFLRKRGPRGPLPIVCVADRRQPAVASEALRLGIADVIRRPVRGDDLAAALANGREFARLIERPVPDTDVPEPADGVFGASAAMRDVLGIVRRVAQSRCGVLIVGERGTGRETIARSIHFHGPWRGQPFIKFRCSEIDPEEFDRVLESGERDAVTILLEDVGEMPADLQARLEAHITGASESPDSALPHGVLSNGVLVASAFRRKEGVASPGVGAYSHDVGVASAFRRKVNAPDTVSVEYAAAVGTIDSAVETAPRAMLRVIGTAHPRIADCVERGLLRRTLIELIGVVRIDLPPLRQRAEDVPLLATYFLKDACRRNRVESKAFSRSALTLLSSLPWPGNASELRSLAEQLAVLVPGGMVLLEDVLANVRLDGAESSGRPRGSLKSARQAFERDHVTAVLQHHKGRMGAAARELGIERTNLYRKIKQLNIHWAVPESP